MCGYLVDFMVPFIRFAALQRICKSYRPHVSLDFVRSELGFKAEKANFADKWLGSCGCQIVSHDALGRVVSTKDTILHASNLEESKNSLI